MGSISIAAFFMDVVCVVRQSKSSERPNDGDKIA